MRLVRFLFAALVVSASLHVSAREPVPVINLTDIAVVRADGKALTEAQVRQAIHNAAGLKQWALSEPQPGRMIATLQVRGKHTVVTEISYSASRYSLTYKDSVNMKYGQRDGQAVIHPFYNRWVGTLNEDIRFALSRI